MLLRLPCCRLQFNIGGYNKTCSIQRQSVFLECIDLYVKIVFEYVYNKQVFSINSNMSTIGIRIGFTTTLTYDLVISRTNNA